MALINSGSFEDFLIQEKSPIITKTGKSAISSKFAQIGKSAQESNLLFKESFFTHEEVSPDTADHLYQFKVSDEERGLTLKSILLTKDFDGIFSKIFNKSNQLYFFAWVYDLSGGPIYFYPGIGMDSSQLLIKLKTGNTREFIGAGINLFPKRKVKGGISVKLQLWECDEKSRNFGKVLSETSEAIQKSNLKKALSLVASATSVPGATVSIITTAALELGKIIGDILQKNGDDQVDLYQGYYPADFPWEQKDDKYSGDASEIVLGRY